MRSADRAASLFSISGRQWLILLTVQLSTLLFGMTITLANVVLPQIRGSLSASQDEISWVNSSLPEQRDGVPSCQQGTNHNDKDDFLVEWIIVQENVHMSDSPSRKWDRRAPPSS